MKPLFEKFDSFDIMLKTYELYINIKLGKPTTFHITIFYIYRTFYMVMGEVKSSLKI
jgi:hypothetical protein